MHASTVRAAFRLLSAIAATSMCVAGVARAQNHPFGSHPFAYAAGAITPNHISQPAEDQAVRAFYDAWKARYLEQTCGAGRYVVLSNTQAGNLTVSEAHGYGMMLAALMAGHDPDAHAIFDGMLAYFPRASVGLHRRTDGLVPKALLRQCGRRRQRLGRRSRHRLRPAARRQAMGKLRGDRLRRRSATGARCDRRSASSMRRSNMSAWATGPRRASRNTTSRRARRTSCPTISRAFAGASGDIFWTDAARPHVHDLRRSADELQSR